MSNYTDTDYSEPKSSAEIQREIELQRSRVENTIDQIQDRLSPGQIVDELLSYTKNGGGEFVSGLGRAVKANPIPVALLGLSVAWLMAGPSKASSSRSYREDRVRPVRAYDYAYEDDFFDDDDFDDLYDVNDEDYPYATVEGSSLRRSYSGSDEKTGGRFSEFVDDAGKKFRAATDELGNRAGHFTDEAGNTYRGFKDSAGNRIASFRDEAGNVIEGLSDWASDTWAKARRALHDARDGASIRARRTSRSVSEAASAFSSSVSRNARRASDAGASAGRGISRAGASAGRRFAEVGSAVGDRGARAARSAADTMHEQPLITGALAFAAGAAIAALLPRTRQEDELLGETADQVKAEAGRRAADLYEQGKEQAASLYSEASSKAGDLYHQATERVGEAYSQARSAVADQAAAARGAVQDAADKTSAAAQDATNRAGDAVRDVEVERDTDQFGNRDQARNI
ncbi:DUF3618 domain-containing protein [Mesorhizobium sp. RP14(2022)]|uniref:DUF3618 domain-containing protein n=1 Tax=Mesorhizobium liriopis TaxID=2953882 RepID=A0ABT1C0J1_9HYPH|nr:DUF3618 domain-containing protein [Mesorhizobium liriopis]MCO6048292.1 DUF3618 domain-containing protein [Mesorhizobium liriopis]